MSTTIEQLELEIQSSSTSAVSGIDALKQSLERLKGITKGGAGLTTVANQISTLDNTLKKINPSNFEKVQRIAKALAPLSNIGKSNLNSFISQLQRLPQAVQALNSVDMAGMNSNITQLVTAFAPLSSMGKNNLTSFVTQIGKIPKMMEGLKALDMKELRTQIEQLADSFKPLAAEMQAISNGFSAFPARIQRLIQQNEKLNASNNKLSGSYVNLAAKVGVALLAMKRAASVVAGWINKSNEYIESLNLFTVSLGEYAGQAKEYANIVGEVMGIDPAEWMHNQGIFMTLATGFGVVSDRAYTMSQNLTQLGYDLASFYNIGFEDAFLKLQSGLSGELEPLRRLGYDLSVARLQQEAYALGIEKKVTAMTQAEKAELRYYAIMTQVTKAQGDMARTLDAPANQLRILKAQVEQAARSLGNIFIPVLNKVLPYAIAVAKVIRAIADAIANLVGFTLPEVDYSGLGSAAGSADDMSDALGDANKKAKDLKKTLSGIDELNIISEDDKASDALNGLGGLGFELPTYDFLGDAVSSKVDEIVRKMKEWLGLTEDIDSWAEFFDTRLGKILEGVLAIGTGFAAWKVAKSIAPFLESLSKLTGLGSALSAVGLLAFVADLKEFVKYFEDFVANGPTFQNVTGMLSEFAGAVGDALIMLGSYKIGGALKVAQGIGEICIAIKDISENGIDWDNATTAIRGLTNVAIGVGVFTGNLKVASWGLAIQGFNTIISEITTNWDAIKQGDWSGVDKATLAIGAIEALGGLAIALDAFSKLKGVMNIGKSATAVKNVATATGGLSTTVATTLTPNLLSLATNLGLGLVVVAEVSAAALLITGAILLMGKGLDEIGKAWEPVLNNAGTIAAGIVTGTVLLVGIGAATAALGSATVASAGLLPLAIAVGTAVLVELAGAFILFTKSLSSVATELSDNLAPALEKVNSKLPALSDHMSDFVDFMTEFAGEVDRYTTVSVIAGLTATVDRIVDWFTEDPIDRMAQNVGKVAQQTGNLNDKLNVAVPELRTATTLLRNYQTLLSELETLTDNNVDLSNGMFVNMKEVGQNLVTGFVDGIKSKSSEFSNAGKELVNGFKTSVTTTADTTKSTMMAWATNVKKWFTDSGYGAVNRNTFRGFGEDIVEGFDAGVDDSASTVKSTMTSWANDIEKWFTNVVSNSAFYNIGKDVVSGFNKGINDYYHTTESYMRKWAEEAAGAYKQALDSHSPSRVFMAIGRDTVLGYNLGISDLGGTTAGVVTDWAKSFTSVSPVMSFAVDTSALRYYSTDSFAKSVSANVMSSSSITADGFKEDLEEFYREFIEPSLSQMAADMRRQADKDERPVVQIGTRVVSDAVNTQRKANGFVFAK